MKRILFFVLAACVLVPQLQFAAPAAAANEEQQLIGVLQSNQSLTQKDAACARLKRIGTAQSIPALAALLTDEKLSHSARYALESMPYPKAGQALAEALGKTSGLTKVGLINSLGFRQETGAVPALVALLTDHDAQVASTASRALGQIGGSKALNALQAATMISVGPVHDALVDACLRCATRLLATGSQSKALAVFEHLYDTEKKDGFRTAVYRGMIQASARKALPRMTA